MSSYVGRHAELYDLFYADKTYPAEAEFVGRCFKKFSDRETRTVLELACGTGRHAFELEKLGYDITATDYSPDMLQVAQQRARESDSKVRFAKIDMRTLPASATEYDAAICLFDSIGYLQTNDALSEMFAGVWHCLRPGGLFIFEFWHDAAMLGGYSPQRFRRWPAANGEVLRLSETTLDRQRNLAKVDYTIHELKKDGSYSTLRETQTNRYFSIAEMRTFLSDTKLEPLRFFSGFHEEESISADTWHVVAVARK